MTRRDTTGGALRRHFSSRLDPPTDAILAFPLFLTYQIGILGGSGRNGVDFTTNALIALSQRDVGTYLLVLLGMLLAYAAALAFLRRRGRFHPRAFGPMLFESSLYALGMGSLIVFVMNRFAEIVPKLSLALGDLGPLDIIVVSAGAGMHEELFFRVLLMGGLFRILRRLTGRSSAWLLALALSSLLFALAHHVGPVAEAFSSSAFAYRSLAGLLFGVIYQLRGFAVVAWTHALYDVFVLSLGPG